MTQYRCASLLAILFLLSGCSPQVTILVPDMMCEEGCAATVHDLLAEQPGVNRVVVDFPAKTAIVTIDTEKNAPDFDAAAAVALLVDHGFDHSTLKASDAAAEPADL